jgi:hypothetical protein
MYSYRGYGMPQHWMGGVPYEHGALPAQIQWLPVNRQTDSPDVFANMVMDLESAMASVGLSLVAHTQGNRTIYRAGDRVVAEAVQVPGGFMGMVHAVPHGKIAGRIGAESLERTQWLDGYHGYGQAGEGPVEPIVEEPTPTREELLAATQAAEEAARQAELQMALAEQAQSFHGQMIAGFISAAGFGIMMWALGMAIQTAEDRRK